jgi:mannose-1-phosphate guanylyltransferase
VDVEDFRKVMTKALEFTSEGRRIVTVGIRPTRPETGYGYIEIASPAGNDRIEAGTSADQIGNPLKVDSFREKPALPVAKEYLAAGNYLWNAGIFVWNVDTIVDSLRSFVPDLAEKMDVMAESFYTDAERDKVGEIFPTCEKISIDYAVMEKADYIYTIPGDFGWSDVGTWGSLWTLLSHDENGNAVVGENVHLNDCKGCIVHAPGAESVVLQGLEDSIVVERDGRLLVCRLSEEQRITDFRK